MARIASISVGGFYPTPAHLLPSILHHLGYSTAEPYAFLDPCAGEGTAICELAHAISPDNASSEVYAVEMEKNRGEAMERNVHRVFGYGRGKVITGDAFQIRWTKGKSDNQGVGLLFLNPPYDQDKVYKRLEERFLRRFTDSLCTDGILCFVIPAGALEASAETLAANYSDIGCFRFPDEDYPIYKQVVVFARKRATPLQLRDEETEGKIRAWGTEPMSLPVLGFSSENWTLPTVAYYPGSYTYRTRMAVGFYTFDLQPLDLIRVRELYKPWCFSTRGGEAKPIRSVLPDPTAESLSTRKYPMAVPPKPAHIAAGIAAGVFNGERVVPDDPMSGAPDILVKGVFDREYETIEEKKDKHGNVTSVVQAQRPRLVVTVLDLKTRQIREVQSSTTITGTVETEHMTTGDLLTLYGRSLLKVLKSHCPVLYDPADVLGQFPLPIITRPLYRAQEHATRALIRLLGGPNVSMAKRKGLAAVLLGEIGVGKSGISLTTALACGAQKILVFCPPHLLESWAEQVSFIDPSIRVMILRSVSDVDAMDAIRGERVLGVLSRETAKLGHGWVSVEGSCPGCGGVLPTEDTVKKRSRCTARTLTPNNTRANILLDVARMVYRLHPTNSVVRAALTGRFMAQAIRRASMVEMDLSTKGEWKRYQKKLLEGIRTNPRAWEIVQRMVIEVGESQGYGNTGEVKALLHFLAGVNNPELTLWATETLLVGGVAFATSEYGGGYLARRTAEDLTLFLSPEQLAGLKDRTSDPGFGKFWREVDSLHNSARQGIGDIIFTEKGVTYGHREMGDGDHLFRALSCLNEVASWKRGEACGTELFQAVGEPLRYPLATYITHQRPNCFDFLIIDEAHEAGNENSAQGIAAHRLVGLGKPSVLLSGSIMNGYAESLFANWWSISREFREEFDRDDHGMFVDRYGYRKRLLQDTDKSTGEVVEYGSMSDRVERKEKDLGSAPGVLPLFVLKMLAHCVTIHKQDLELNLPPCREIVVRVAADDEQSKVHTFLVGELLQQVKKDRYTPLAGKLWGQMSEIPSHLDRATKDTGNMPDGAYEIRYPESEARRLVARGEPLGYDPLPKEREMLDTIAKERSEGRNVLVLTWHVELIPRLQKLIETRFGWKVPVLDPAKVPTGKRQSWIDKHVVKPNAPVLITNPVCVQTGLNVLVHFASQWWHENPACNPVVYRQAKGRSDRIGQDKEVRIFLPRYTVISQEKAMSLLFHKVGVSMATDGLDSESALTAAGVGDIGVSGLSVGKELYNMISEVWT